MLFDALFGPRRGGPSKDSVSSLHRKGFSYARSHAWLCITALLTFLVIGRAHSAEVIPPPPPDHFNDYVGVVPRETGQQLNRELTQFERDTSNQILVVIYSRMQSASSLEDYTTRVFEAWHPGEKRRSNGAILFVFTEDRRVRIQTGYGLEGALPDALAKQIIENEITPRFRTGDFAGGVVVGARAMMAATRGEYRGTGRTAADAGSGAGSGVGQSGIFILIFAAIVVMGMMANRRRGTVYGRRGSRGLWMGPGPWMGGGGGGGWSGGGGGGSFGGGSFSGGGGSTGGGGASGSW